MIYQVQCYSIVKIPDTQIRVRELEGLDESFRLCPKGREHLGTEVTLVNGGKVSAVLFLETGFSGLLKASVCPTSALLSCDDTIDFIGLNQPKIGDVDYFRIFRFWEMYPEGLIEFV